MNTTCKVCLFTSEIPLIVIANDGICNYCKVQNRLSIDYPRGTIGVEQFKILVDRIKKDGKGKDYDCIVGVSGGTDSTYLLLLAKEYGLRPLAVNVDNGWHTEIAVQNIKNALDILKIDLRTYVIDWQEMKNIHLSFMKAGLPWPDGTTDVAINSALYKIAAEEGVKYVMNGHDFRSEGKQPLPWTYTDSRMIRSIVKRFSGIKLNSYPNLNPHLFFYYTLVKGIQDLRPFWFVPYSKIEARKIIENTLNWKYYGGHHHENIFTRFIIGYWLPKKFGIDKRLVTYSAQIRSGEISREEGVKLMNLPPYDPEQMEKDKNYVIEKLEITKIEFEEIWNSPNKSFMDYPSYYPFYQKTKKISDLIFKFLIPYKPMTSYSLDKV